MQNDSMRGQVMDLLKKLPANYHYHNFEHTLYVEQKAIEIAKAEECTKDEIKLLSAAALWHDTGFINTYKGHEEESCKLAKKHLPEFGYSVKDIEIICGMIMATKLPQSPKNKLEEILADADLEYLGTTNAETISQRLFEEWKSMNSSLTQNEWRARQISFLKDHHYFTRCCKTTKEKLKLEYLQKLMDRN